MVFNDRILSLCRKVKDDSLPIKERQHIANRVWNLSTVSEKLRALHENGFLLHTTFVAPCGKGKWYKRAEQFGRIEPRFVTGFRDIFQPAIPKGRFSRGWYLAPTDEDGEPQDKPDIRIFKKELELPEYLDDSNSHFLLVVKQQRGSNKNPEYGVHPDYVGSIYDIDSRWLID